MAQDHYAALFTKLSEEGFDSREFVRRLVERGLQELIDAGVAAHIGADPHERTSGRTNRRNGKRTRTVTTQAGDIEIALLKLREGSWFPEFLEPRRRIDHAMYAVVIAYIKGVSTCKVGKLVMALGSGHGISKSEVSRICECIDAQVKAFRERDLGATNYPRILIAGSPGCGSPETPRSAKTEGKRGRRTRYPAVDSEQLPGALSEPAFARKEL